jgi:hypothetical protein
MSDDSLRGWGHEASEAGVAWRLTFGAKPSGQRLDARGLCSSVLDANALILTFVSGARRAAFSFLEHALQRVLLFAGQRAVS